MILSYFARRYNASVFLSWGLHAEQSKIPRLEFKPPEMGDKFFYEHGREEVLPRIVDFAKKHKCRDVCTVWDAERTRKHAERLRKEKPCLFDTSLPRPDDET